ncbi:hypothetical protein [Photobacterium carnosum]|jgi:hypothetical protein|uniref:Uncharacterized protein n=1 Tax=Photobacterium carnosum TaxID=2023717 RepID=A0A2N4UP14_9GAMM|nr:hypothetical protein [Photobacterium carnosum]MBY3789842.1 hypothetical protein [Photobacterium carnosum]MCD9496473.1 hypothetical protein [Photobacterium carnosum]MCD9515976.1 hypothetical protein [Photobacterium carnosum]MCD9523985.1 hypothetical protein [Photobacterium carnosum]MCD9528324.1 hypothetical protein [Photobacterium carnosum]
MSGFAYPHTCPLIDKQIGRAKGDLTTYARDLLRSYNIEISGKEMLLAGEELFSALSDIFEKTRKTNEDMRTEAHKQIVALEAENMELRALLYCQRMAS